MATCTGNEGVSVNVLVHSIITWVSGHFCQNWDGIKFTTYVLCTTVCNGKVIRGWSCI